MQAEVGSYLDEVRTHLHLDSRTQSRVISELYTHFQEKVSDLEDSGMPESEATREALEAFGDARSIARMMYEAHSRGSWTEALISCQPHLIVAALFATHIWRNPVLLGGAFAAIVVIALLGWRRGASPWLYSWVGFAVLPLLVFSFLSINPVARTVTWVLRGQGTPAPLWHLAVLIVIYAFSLWLIAAATMAVARTDWILVSLMLLPLPMLAIWLISVSQSGQILDALHSLEGRFSRWDGAMAGIFLLLGVTTVLFIRVRRRAVKVVSVLAVGIVGGAVAVSSMWGEFAVLKVVAVAVGLFLFLTIPFLVRALFVRDTPSNPLPS
jgi:hypothetical protein